MSLVLLHSTKIITVSQTEHASKEREKKCLGNKK